MLLVMSQNHPTNPIEKAPPVLVMEVMRQATVCVRRGEFEKTLELLAQLDTYREGPDADANVLRVLDMLRSEAEVGLVPVVSEEDEEPKAFAVLKRRSPTSQRRLDVPRSASGVRLGLGARKGEDSES